MLRRNEPAVVAFGGGALGSKAIRSVLSERAVTVYVEVEADVAWQRVRHSDRPLAKDEVVFRALHAEREPLYREVADAVAGDRRRCRPCRRRRARRARLARAARRARARRPGRARRRPARRRDHGADAQLALGGRVVSTHEVSGKSAHDLETLWRALRIDRAGTIVALGGGTATDLAGFAAATYMRGVDWVAVPTTLVGQVDAAIGGKTAVDLPEAKNLVGAFHWPIRTIVDPALLATLPEEERLNGMAEVVKTGLLAGEPLWELPDAELVRRCAAYKSALCLRDPHDRGPRHALNLGHTFGHAIESASGYAIPHGRAVALGLLAALRLSGRDTTAVEEVLSPERARVDRDRAWEALLRDKKGRLRIVLLGEGGAEERELPEADVRAALDALIAE